LGLLPVVTVEILATITITSSSPEARIPAAMRTAQNDKELVVGDLRRADGGVGE
jgi:hypothetical protein